MEYKNNNQKDYKKSNSVNTRGIQFMNANNSFSQSTLVVGWWDNFITFNLHPALDKNEQRPDKIYNYTINLSTALNPEKMQLMRRIHDEYIQPALNEGKEVSASISTGGNSLVTLGVAIIDKIPRPYFKISKNLDENRIPEAELSYLFNLEQQIILNYDSSNGNFEAKNIQNTEYELFISLLIPSSIDLVGACGHISRVTDRFDQSKRTETLNGIASKLGVETNSGKTFYKSNPFNNTKANNTPAEEEISLEVTEGLSDIPF